MALLIGRKGVLEDRLQRDERHRSLRTSVLRASLGCFAQYHANYPRCKRLVQRRICYRWHQRSLTTHRLSCSDHLSVALNGTVDYPPALPHLAGRVSPPNVTFCLYSLACRHQTLTTFWGNADELRQDAGKRTALCVLRRDHPQSAEGVIEAQWSRRQ